MANFEIKAEEDGMYMVYEDGEPVGQRQRSEQEALADMQARQKNLLDQERGPVRTVAQDEAEEEEKKIKEHNEEIRRRVAEQKNNPVDPLAPRDEKSRTVVSTSTEAAATTHPKKVKTATPHQP